MIVCAGRVLLSGSRKPEGALVEGRCEGWGGTQKQLI